MDSINFKHMLHPETTNTNISQFGHDDKDQGNNTTTELTTHKQ
jgi:hypothetical protein